MADTINASPTVLSALRRQQMIDSLMGGVVQPRPMTSPWEALAQVGSAGLLGYLSNRAGRKVTEAQGQAARDEADAFAQAMGGMSSGSQFSPQLPQGMDRPETLQAGAQEQNSLADTMLSRHVGRRGQIVPYAIGLNNYENPGRMSGGPSTSTASGGYQIVDGTWEEIRSRNPNLGLPANVEDASAEQQTAALDKGFTPGLVNTLKGMGIEPTAGNTLAMHVLGQGDGSKFFRALKGSPNTPVSQVITPAAIQANGRLFTNPDGSSKTVAQVNQYWQQRMANVAPPVAAGGPAAVPQVGGGGAVPAVATQMQDEAPTFMPAMMPQRMGASPQQVAQVRALLSNPSTHAVGQMMAQRMMEQSAQAPKWEKVGDDVNGTWMVDTSGTQQPVQILPGRGKDWQDPNYRAWKIQEAQAGRSNVSVTTPMESEYQKKTGGFTAEDAHASRQQVVANSKLEVTLKQMEDAMDGVETGATEEAKLRAKKIFSSVLGINFDGVSQQEQLLAISSRLQASADLLKTQGAVSERERDMMGKVFPSLSNTPEGNRLIIAGLRNLAAFDSKVAEIWAANKKAHGGNAPDPDEVNTEIQKLGDPFGEVGGRIRSRAAEMDRQGGGQPATGGASVPQAAAQPQGLPPGIPPPPFSGPVFDGNGQPLGGPAPAQPAPARPARTSAATPPAQAQPIVTPRVSSSMGGAPPVSPPVPRSPADVLLQRQMAVSGGNGSSPAQGGLRPVVSDGMGGLVYADTGEPVPPNAPEMRNAGR